ncbi:MAG: polyprenol monophosphomannose synthase [Pirellulales bacterium]|nr:polyprenol monophosphomannose synthase [Pirellulales bacterium]
MPMLVAIATYNERENLPSLMAAVRDALPDAKVVVVDDNSPDGTGAWCDQQARQCNWLHVIHRSGKQGLGSATWAAMQWAIAQRAEWLATLDADWSHPPDALPRLVETQVRTGADVVIGSRYCPGGIVDGWPLSRRLVSRAVNLATRAALGLPVRDASTAFRLYRVAALERLDFSLLRENGYAYLEEMLWRLREQGATFAETPITFTDRREGESKVTAGEGLGKLRMLLRLGWRRLSRR